MSVKEMEILCHRSIDWDYSFEEFVCPPTVEENALTLSVKVYITVHLFGYLAVEFGSRNIRR